MAEQLDGLLQGLAGGHDTWSHAIAPLIMANPDRPSLAADLAARLCVVDPAIALRRARATLLTDLRPVVPQVFVAEGVADAATAAVLAERLLARLGQPHLPGGMQVHSGVSIGITLGHGGSTSARFMRDADTAMYEATRQGRGRDAHFEPGMHTRANAAFELERLIKSRRGRAP